MEYMDCVAPPSWPGSWKTPLRPPTRTAGETYASPQDPRALHPGYPGYRGRRRHLRHRRGPCLLPASCGTELLSCRPGRHDPPTGAAGRWPEDSADDQLGYGLGWDKPLRMFPFGQKRYQAFGKGGAHVAHHAGLIVLPGTRYGGGRTLAPRRMCFNQLARAHPGRRPGPAGDHCGRILVASRGRPARPQAVLSYAGTAAGPPSMPPPL